VDDELDDEFGGEDDEGKEETAAEERRRSQSDASASDSEGGGGMGGEVKGAGDNKAASFARAFAKIMATGGTQKGILSVSSCTMIETLTLFICEGRSGGCSHFQVTAQESAVLILSSACNAIYIRSRAGMNLLNFSCSSRLK